MCYSIPGKITEINPPYLIVDYFGEKKRVRNDFLSVQPGDYIYAQGGFAIQKISAAEARPVLAEWQNVFQELKKIDLRLSEKSRNLYQIANNLRQKYTGNSSCVHGIIEFSNYCNNDCLYCGLRRSNRQLVRYRMEKEVIISAADYAISELGFKALVLQSGEDSGYEEEELAAIISEIMKKKPVLIILSIGERPLTVYQKFYEAGARGILLRFETSNPEIYARMKPGHQLSSRLQLLGNLKAMGYILISGFLIGLPRQTEEDIIRDIKTTAQLGVEMFSFGPFIPHPDTPLKEEKNPPLKMILETIARTRILYPDSRILVTTATESLAEDAAQRALLSGANSLMINVTPLKYHSWYYLYPGRAGNQQKISERISRVLQLLKSLGRVPSDVGLTWSDRELL